MTTRGGPDNPSRMMDMAAMVSKAFSGGTKNRKLNVQNGCSSTAVIYSLFLSLGFGYLTFGNRFQARPLLQKSILATCVRFSLLRTTRQILHLKLT